MDLCIQVYFLESENVWVAVNFVLLFPLLVHDKCASHDVYVGTGWARTWQGVSESQESHVRVWGK